MNEREEIDSFNLQSSLFNEKVVPKADQVLHRLEMMYAKGKAPLPRDWCSDEHIKRCLDEVDVTKNPGSKFQREGLSVNADVIERYGVEGIIEQVKDRIEELIHLSDLCNCHSPSESDLMRLRSCATPLKVFVKREPHNMKKVNTKRWRLIFGVCLIDQIVDRVLYSHILDEAIAQAAHLPSKPGFSFKKGGADALYRKYNDNKSGWSSFDASSHDMTVSYSQLKIVRDLNERLTVFNDNDNELKWKTLSRAREEAAAYGSLAFSCGKVLLKTKPGLQISGRLLTIDSNCKIVCTDRVSYDIHCGRLTKADEIFCMGDDTVQNGLEDRDDFLKYLKETLGANFTVESEIGYLKDMNFCSSDLTFDKGKAVFVPRNWEKNMYALAHLENLDTLADTLRSLCIEYYYHPKWSIIYTKYCSVNTKPESREWFRAINTGFESSQSA